MSGNCKRLLLSLLLLVSLCVFSVNSFAIDNPSGDRFFTVDGNGFVLEEPEHPVLGNATTDNPVHVVDSGEPPAEPPTVDYGMHFIVLIFVVAMVGGTLLCMIFFDRL